MDEAGQASRDQAGLEALGSQRQVRGRDETAERLSERRPRVIPAQLAAQRLRVVHDLILAEVAQVGCLLLVRAQVGERLGVHAGRLARASLIEEHHPIVLEEPVHPPARERAETRARVARATLQEHRVGGVLAALAHDLAGEHLDRRVVLAGGAQVIQGDLEAVLVNRVTVVNVRLCVHGHNGSGLWRCCVARPRVTRAVWCLSARALRYLPLGPFGAFRSGCAWRRPIPHGSSKTSHVIPLRVFQTLKSCRWDCNVCGVSRKMTKLNYVQLLGGARLGEGAQSQFIRASSAARCRRAFRRRRSTGACAR